MKSYNVICMSYDDEPIKRSLPVYILADDIDPNIVIRDLNRNRPIDTVRYHVKQISLVTKW